MVGISHAYVTRPLNLQAHSGVVYPFIPLISLPLSLFPIIMEEPLKEGYLHKAHPRESFLSMTVNAIVEERASLK